MGMSTADLMEKHGSEEYVVLHNLVMVRDPDDVATDPKDYTFAAAHRGDRVTLDGRSAERLLAEGAVAAPDSDSSKFAEAGLRDPATLGIPPSATQMAPQSERTQTMRVVVQDRFGDPAALMRLDVEQLQTVALAFGIPFKATDDKAALAKAILGSDASDAVSAHDEAASARAVARQQTDLPPAEQQARGGSSSRGSSRSRSSRGEAGATESAQKLADEHGIDVSSVEGTGADGQVTQPDVAKAIADRDAS